MYCNDGGNCLWLVRIKREFKVCLKNILGKWITIYAHENVLLIVKYLDTNTFFKNRIDEVKNELFVFSLDWQMVW